MPAGALSLVLHVPGGAGLVACVVACHGLRASKDSDKYVLLGDVFTRAGVALARFDFRPSGESEGLAEGDTMVASRVDDTLAVVAFLSKDPSLDGRFGLLGSSMGGFVALHARDALGDSIPVVTWNAPASRAISSSSPAPITASPVAITASKPWRSAWPGSGNTFARDDVQMRVIGFFRSRRIGRPCVTGMTTS